MKSSTTGITAEYLCRRIAGEIGVTLPVPRDPNQFRAKYKARFTARLNTILTNIGSTHGMNTKVDSRVNHCKEEGISREFDLVWLKDGRMHLALESEWLYQLKHMAFDFEKLLHADCPMKVFVHRRRDQEGDVLPYLIEAMSQFDGHVKDEEYVIIQITDYCGNLVSHRFRVPTNGGIAREQIHFAPGNGSPYPWTVTSSLK